MLSTQTADPRRPSVLKRLLMVLLILVIALLVVNLVLGSSSWGAGVMVLVGCGAVIGVVMAIGKTPEDVTR